MAGVALGDIHFRFMWQAWYLWDWAGSGDPLGPAVTPRLFAWQAWHLARQAWHLATSTVVLRGRRGTCWTGLALARRLVPRRGGSLRGGRGTWRHPPSFHVAGVALGDIHLRLRGRRGTYWTGLALARRLVPL